VRNWLQANLPSSQVLPSSALLVRRYLEFRRQLPFICRMESSTPAELTFLDYKRLVTYWIEENPEALPVPPDRVSAKRSPARNGL